MFGLGRHGPDGKYAVVLDIGSASVGAAIVASDTVTDENPIIYSKRIPAIITNVSKQKPDQIIKEALLQIFMDLSGPGQKALTAYDSSASITYIQTTITAPWSHTTSQQADYEDTDEFTITETVLDSLVTDAKKAADPSLNRKAELMKSGLAMITSQTLHITANGYTVQNPVGLKAKKVYISHAIGTAPKFILDTIQELRDKTFPKARIGANTFMLLFYSSLRELFPNASEACLIDLTGEATEVAVVRNFELTKVSHADFGTRTLVRMLNEKLKLPDGTAESILANEPVELTDKQQLVVDSIYDEYTENLAVLIKSLGTILTVPKAMYIHTKAGYEDTFTKLLTDAASRATGGSHMGIPITRVLTKHIEGSDSNLYLSSNFFHKLHRHNAQITSQ